MTNNVSTNVVESYQTAVIIPQNVWSGVLQRLERLENTHELQQNQVIDENTIYYSHTETAQILGIHKESLLRAKRNGKIKGVRNGKGFSYSLAEINRYKGDKPRYKNQ